MGCMEPHTPESMTTSLYIVQEFMSGNTLKVFLFSIHAVSARIFCHPPLCFIFYP